jgi:heme oxygenase
MAERKIELELPDDLLNELDRVAEALGLASAVEAAMIGVADWVLRRKAELDDRDPGERYFVNEALDDLIGQRWIPIKNDNVGIASDESACHFSTQDSSTNHFV